MRLWEMLMEPQRLMCPPSLKQTVFNYLLSICQGGQVLHGVEEEGLQGAEKKRRGRRVT